MKIRTGFVSNSSSSSFTTTHYKDVFEVATIMLNQRYEAWGDDEESKSHDGAIKTIAQAREAGMDPNTPIVFNSPNYETYIAYDRKTKRILVSTCNNVAWEIRTDWWSDCFEDENDQKIMDSTSYWSPESDMYGREEYVWGSMKQICPTHQSRIFTSGVSGEEFCSNCGINLLMGVCTQPPKTLVVVGSVTGKNGVLYDHDDSMAMDPTADAYVYVILVKYVTGDVGVMNTTVQHILVGHDGYRELKFGKIIGDSIMPSASDVKIINQEVAKYLGR